MDLQKVVMFRPWGCWLSHFPQFWRSGLSLVNCGEKKPGGAVQDTETEDDVESQCSQAEHNLTQTMSHMWVVKTNWHLFGLFVGASQHQSCSPAHLDTDSRMFWVSTWCVDLHFCQKCGSSWVSRQWNGNNQFGHPVIGPSLLCHL